MTGASTFVLLVTITSAQAWERCPKKCACHERLVHCGNKGLLTMPKRLPPGTLEFFADRNNITELPTRMLSNGESLRKLILSRNKVTSLRLDNFPNTPSLKNISLSHNNISFVPANAFFGLEELRILRLDSNKISRLSQHAFKDLFSLRELTLSDNRINTLPEGLFTSQLELKILRLDRNQIAVISHGIFRSLISLTTLNLSRNRIHHISTGGFRGLQNLKELRLDHNKISSLDSHLPSLNVSCQTMSVGKSTFSDVLRTSKGKRGAFYNLRELRTLDVRHNRLTTLQFASFATLQNLRTLNLAHNPWRCDCALKWTIETLLNKSLGLNKIKFICKTPKSVTDSNLNELSYDDLADTVHATELVTRSVNTELSINTEPYLKSNDKRFNRPPSRDTSRNTLHAGGSQSGGGKSTNERPSNDLVTRDNGVGPSTELSATLPPSRSLIPTLQAGPIATSTSSSSSYLGNNWGSGVSAQKPSNYVATKPVNWTQIHQGAGTESSHANASAGFENGSGNIEPPHLSGPKVTTGFNPNQVWLIASVIVLSIIAFLACTSLVIQRYLTRRSKGKGCCMKSRKGDKKSSIRCVTSYPLLYDSHHFARRPLPRAPSLGQRSQQSPKEEVRWTNGGVYGLGSNRCSFISLQNFDNVGSYGEPQGSSTQINSSNTQNDTKLSEIRCGRNVYSYVETVPPNILNRRCESQSQKLPSAPSSEKFHHAPLQRSYSEQTEQKTSELEIRKEMEGRRRRKRKTIKTMTFPDSEIIISTVHEATEMNQPPPPVPKRNESSRSRCRELKKQEVQRKRSQNSSGYYEIAPTTPNEIAEFKRNILYKKYVEKVLNKTTNEPRALRSQFLREREIQVHKSFRSHSSSDMEGSEKVKLGLKSNSLDCWRPGLERTPRGCGRLGYRAQGNFGPNRTSSSEERNSVLVQKYEKLALCTSGDCQLRPASLKRENDGISSSCSESSFVQEDVTCFSNAGEEFDVYYPSISSRRTYPRGAFGSDQNILDSLQEQEEKIRKAPQHHTAPVGIEALTLPLSEISTDDEDEEVDLYEVLSHECERKTAGKEKDVQDDVFVYTMAGEAASEVIPKILINDENKEHYEYLDKSKRCREVNFLQNHQNHHYQHLQFMYSGFSRSGPTQKAQPQKNEKNNVAANHANSSLQPQCRNGEVFKSRRRERHYCSIDFDDDDHSRLRIKDSDNEGEFTFVEGKNMKNTHEEVAHLTHERECYLNAANNRIENTGGISRSAEREENESKETPQREIVYRTMEGELYHNGLKQKSNPHLIPKDTEVSKGEDDNSTIGVNKELGFPSSSKYCVESPSREGKNACKAEEKNPHLKPLKFCNASGIRKDVLQVDSPVKSNRPQKSRLRRRRRPYCSIKMDQNKNPVVTMSNGVTTSQKNVSQETEKISSKNIGYFEPPESSPDEGTDEEMFDLEMS